LKIIPELSQSPYLKDKVSNLLISFPELYDFKVTISTFENLVFDRKTIRYKDAIEIAAMLLLNYRPDIISGKNHVLAILFDMNDLWEEYIFRQLSRFKPENFQIRPQSTKIFWKSDSSNFYKKIRPDITILDKETGESLIIDTKWKIPENNIPSDNDLKQMYVYNEYWCGKQAFLVYPHYCYTDEPVFYGGEFAQREKNAPTHKCGILKIPVLDKQNNQLDNTIGFRINNFLNKHIFDEIQYIR